MLPLLGQRRAALAPQGRALPGCQHGAVWDWRHEERDGLKEKRENPPLSERKPKGAHSKQTQRVPVLLPNEKNQRFSDTKTSEMPVVPLRFISSPDIPAQSQRGIRRHSQQQPKAANRTASLLAPDPTSPHTITSTGIRRRQRSRTSTLAAGQARFSEKPQLHRTFISQRVPAALREGGPSPAGTARHTERRHRAANKRAAQQSGAPGPPRPAPGTCWGSRGRGPLAG